MNGHLVYLDSVLLLYHFEDLKSTLEVTNSSNQLAQGCDLYLRIVCQSCIRLSFLAHVQSNFTFP